MGLRALTTPLPLAPLHTPPPQLLSWLMTLPAHLMVRQRTILPSTWSLTAQAGSVHSHSSHEYHCLLCLGKIQAGTVAFVAGIQICINPMHLLCFSWARAMSHSVCVCVRESVRPRQHVTRPTGVAETRFDEDPEAEEAAAANADDADISTPTFKTAPDSSFSDTTEGMCWVPHGQNFCHLMTE